MGLNPNSCAGVEVEQTGMQSVWHFSNQSQLTPHLIHTDRRQGEKYQCKQHKTIDNTEKSYIFLCQQFKNCPEKATYLHDISAGEKLNAILQ